MWRLVREGAYFQLLPIACSHIAAALLELTDRRRVSGCDAVAVCQQELTEALRDVVACHTQPLDLVRVRVTI